MTTKPIDRLRSLTVADVMNKHVVTVGADQQMSDVAKVFLENGIAAAPVVDHTSHFVGILSATDFLRRDSASSEGRAELARQEKRWEIPPSGPDRASSYMTTAVQTVSPDTSLLRAAMIMSAAHIHRLPVLDDQNRVVGMVSTMDITAAVLNIVDELDADLLTQITATSQSRK